jgi:hypothetical protein
MQDVKVSAALMFAHCSAGIVCDRLPLSFFGPPMVLMSA